MLTLCVCGIDDDEVLSILIDVFVGVCDCVGDELARSVNAAAALLFVNLCVTDVLALFLLSDEDMLIIFVNKLFSISRLLIYIWDEDEYRCIRVYNLYNNNI